MIRRGMKFRHHGSILVLTSMLALASIARAQEAAYLDLTDTIPRLELRHPPAPPAKCDHGCVGGGIGGGSVGDFGDGANEKHVLTATLTWMDRVEYQDGDEAIVEVRLQNTGELPVSIAWSPHLADMQPPNETDKFTVLSLGIAVELKRGRAICLSGRTPRAIWVAGTALLYVGSWSRRVSEGSSPNENRSTSLGQDRIA